jgi:hypothetical protein
LEPSNGKNAEVWSAKLENRIAAALQYFVYNFLWIHRPLRVTPGVRDRLWEPVRCTNHRESTDATA